jgi:hypothetical protein
MGRAYLKFNVIYASKTLESEVFYR